MTGTNFTTKHLIYYGNSNLMQKVPSESVHLVVTSPPYPMIEMWDDTFSKLNPLIKEQLVKEDGFEAHRLMSEELEKTWREVARVLMPGGIACINIGDATRKIGKNFRLFSNHSKVITCFDSMRFMTLPEILWRKQSNKPNKFMGSGMLPTSAYVTQEHEYILIFRKGESRRFEPGDESRYRSAFFWKERNVWFSDIWMDLKGISQKLEGSNSRDRAAAFPFELAYRLMNMYSIQGDTVLDPFLGTGTTMLAAMSSGRNSIGYEIEPSFHGIIDKKVDGFIDHSNEYIMNRIRKHVDFIRERDLAEKETKYLSKKYGFKVMTKQELEISFYQIAEIKKKPDFFGYEVKYRELDKTDF